MLEYIGPILSGLAGAFSVYFLSLYTVNPEKKIDGNTFIVEFGKSLKITAILLGAMTAFIVYAAYHAAPDQQILAALVSTVFVAGYIYLSHEIFFTRIVYHDSGFVFRNAFVTKAAHWDDITDCTDFSWGQYYVLHTSTVGKIRMSYMISGLDGMYKYIEMRLRHLYPERFVVHEHAFFNRLEIEKSTACGCFCCLNVYPAKLVQEWDKMEDLGEIETAVCPNCQSHGVIGDASGYSIELEALKKVHNYMFG